MVFFSLLSYTTIFDAIAPQPNSVHERPKTTPRGHFG